LWKEIYAGKSGKGKVLETWSLFKQGTSAREMQSDIYTIFRIILGVKHYGIRKEWPCRLKQYIEGRTGYNIKILIHFLNFEKA
jgi:hypothetical protein